MGLKQKIKSLPQESQDFLSYLSRSRGAKSDLIKGLSHSVAITMEQKRQILSFWKPFLTTWKEKHSFDIRWFDIYNRTNVFGFDLEYYIPDSYYYSIVDKCFTNALDCNVFDDKNLYNLYFSDANQPLTIFHKSGGVFLDDSYRLITENEAVEKCLEIGFIILKPSINALAGRGICFWKKDQNSLQELKNIIASHSNLVVQKIVQQHSFMANFTNSCVNTMRIVTLIWEGEVKVTTAVLIMGGPSAKTNHLHSGGIVCGILPDGRLRHTAFDGHLNAYQEHPNGIRFADVQIPNYDKCLELVKRLAPRMAGVSKFLNWDLTLDENGEPLLIEVNLTWGGSVQIAAGPAFGDLTKDVLDYVKKNGRWKV